MFQDFMLEKIAVQGGFLELLEVQLPGKRKMAIKDLLNGFTFSADAKVLWGPMDADIGRFWNFPTKVINNLPKLLTIRRISLAITCTDKISI